MQPPPNWRMFLQDHTTGLSVVTRWSGVRSVFPEKTLEETRGMMVFPDWLLFNEGGDRPGPKLSCSPALGASARVCPFNFPPSSAPGF